MKRAIISSTIIYQDNGANIKIVKLGGHLFARNGDTLRVSEVVFEGNNLKIIEEYAFYGNAITNLILPDTVTEIGSYAFSRNQITGPLTIPNALTKIGWYTFAWNEITSLEFGNSLKEIKPYCFIFNQITSITFPELEMIIEECVFMYNPLTSIDFGNSVKSIWERAFYGTQLSTITIPESVMTMGNSVFGDSNFSSSSIINLPARFDTHYGREWIFDVDYWEGSRPWSVKKNYSTISQDKKIEKTNHKKRKIISLINKIRKIKSN